MTQFSTRPVIMGAKGVVTSGHYLATAAGFRIMEAGGNAIDAAAAMCFCVNLLEPQSNGIGGEVPTLVYSAEDRQVHAISGMGWSPKEFTLDWCRENGIDLIPGDGFLPACVPATVDTWAVALTRFGTKTFGEVLAPAIELAENGFAVYRGLRDHIQSHVDLYVERYPATAKIYCPDGRVPEVGELIRNPDFARTLRLMCEAEESASGSGRAAGIEAARDAFYRGTIAETIEAYIRDNPVEDASGRAHAGLLSLEDMAEWRATVEPDPPSYEYHGLRVYKCPTWTQGPVFLQQLALLRDYDLAGMGHNSAEYLHTLTEAAKLAFADREAYYGDQNFDHVPMDGLLSDAYNAGRRALIGGEASLELRPGSVDGLGPVIAPMDVAADNRQALGVEARPVQDIGLSHSHVGDTTHLDAVDRHGNMVAATPSGGWIRSSPVIEGLGFCLGTRGQMFYLNPDRPNALAPHKRPRATLTPSLATRDGEPEMVFGTPGGDSQDQWTLQFFLNYMHFGMDLQQALDEPSVHSIHFPSSFYPRSAYPGTLMAESRLSGETIAELERRGHTVQPSGPWAHGKTMAIRIDRERGVIHGAVTAKGGIGYALGW